MRTAAAVLIAAGILAWGGSAAAQVIGDPVPSINKGNLDVGVSLESFSRDLSYEGGGSDSVDYSRAGFRVDYGWAKNRAIQFFISETEIDPGPGGAWRGPEVGIGYRQPIDITIPIAGRGAPTALFGDFRYGNTEDGSTFKYFQYQFGYGGSFPFSRTLDIYAAALYSDVYGRIEGNDVRAVDNIGFMGGVDFLASSNIRLTAELHIFHEFGIGLMIQFML